MHSEASRIGDPVGPTPSNLEWRAILGSVHAAKMVGMNRIGMTCHRLEKMTGKMLPLILAQHFANSVQRTWRDARLGVNRLSTEKTRDGS